MATHNQPTLDRSEPDGSKNAWLAAALAQAQLSQAATLARRGEYGAAESVLRGLLDSGGATPAVCDMLARIRAQQGRFSDAEALWQRALQLAPDNESYAAGLRRIAQSRTPTFWGTPAKILGATVVVLLLVWVSGWIVELRFHRFEKAMQSEMTRLKEDLIKIARARPSSPWQTSVGPGDGAPSKAESQVEAKAEAAPPRLALDTPGTTSRAEGDELVVTFDEGLFESRADLTPKAQETLSALAARLRPYSANLHVRVIGCTNNAPVPEGWAFPDNASLGLARSVAVADYLRGREGLPTGMFLLQSWGEMGAPYPNDTPENRQRNRTVVFRLSVSGQDGGREP